MYRQTPFIISGMSAGILMSMLMPAFAGTASTAWVDAGTVGGHSYQARSTVYTNTAGYTDAHSSAEIRTAGGDTVPAGYVGVNSFLYKAGSLCKSTGTTYNDGPTNDFTVYWFSTDCGPGVYSASGAAYARRSDGTYKATATGSSPNQNQNS